MLMMIDKANAAAIRQAGGLEILVKLLSSDNELVQENAAGAIWNLAQDGLSITVLTCLTKP